MKSIKKTVSAIVMRSEIVSVFSVNAIAVGNVVSNAVADAAYADAAFVADVCCCCRC